MIRFAVLASAVFVLLGAIAPATAQNLYGANCPGFAARSPSSNNQLNVTFRNESPARQDIYWVNFNGGLKLYKTLFPGQTYNVNTYAGHIWLAWEGNHCNYWFTASRNETVHLR